MGRFSSGDAAPHGAGQDALTGRRSGCGRESARHVSQSAQTRSGVVDLCVGGGSGTYKQLRGASLTASRIVAAAQLWHPECGGQSICRAHLNHRHDPTPTAPGRVGLLDDHLHGSDSPRSCAFPLTADFPTSRCSLVFVPRCAVTILKVNAIVRGWMNYYRFAAAAQRTFSDLLSQVFKRVAHYLAAKSKTTIPIILAQYSETV